jgi:5'-nucleotidase
MLVALLGLAAASCGSSGSDDATDTGRGVTTTTAAPSVQHLDVLVTNDDGYEAEGIDSVVEALRKLPEVTVTVVAPAANQSGAGPKTTDGPLAHHEATTRSGYPAVAVEGHPADTIRVALDDLHLQPDLVVSGVNLGQNLGPLLGISGTVGAARAAAARGIPAVAASQGVGDPIDYGVATEAVVTWIEAHRGELPPPGSAVATVVNINAPSCGTTGEPRGTVDAPPATGGPALAKADCSSTVTDPPDDVTALNAGFVVVAKIPA